MQLASKRKLSRVTNPVRGNQAGLSKPLVDILYLTPTSHDRPTAVHTISQRKRTGAKTA